MVGILLVGIFSGYALSSNIGWQYKDSFIQTTKMKFSSVLYKHIDRFCDPEGNSVYLAYGPTNGSISLFVLSKSQSKLFSIKFL